MSDNSDNSDVDDAYGPSLPPDFIKEENKPRILGPSLPKNFKLPSENDYEELNENDNDNNDDEEENDDLVIGPLLPGTIDLNHKAEKPKSLSNEVKGPIREKWMLEPSQALRKTLPTKSVTKFQQKNSKERPLTEQELMELQAKEEKDKKMNEFLQKYEQSNKRNISLLESHRQEMKKKKKIALNEKSERREFDREKDLCAPRMDSRTKNSLINQASSAFGTRFSTGKFEKFL